MLVTNHSMFQVCPFFSSNILGPFHLCNLVLLLGGNAARFAQDLFLSIPSLHSVPITKGNAYHCLNEDV